MNAAASFKSASKPSSRSSGALLPVSAVILFMLLNAIQFPSAVQATDDVANLSPWELESIINQLVNPSPEYQLHASALRNQLKNILLNRQLAVGEEQSLNDYDYPEEDKRSVASLASRGLLRGAGKRGLATLAKNGQLPTQEPEDEEEDDLEAAARVAAKRYIGALARSGGLASYGKRNIGTLARDFNLPQNGKRNVATLARLGLITSNREPKRNVASVARYNSNRMSSTASSALDAEKRNLGALKSSPVHGFLPQKRDDEESIVPGVEVDYVDLMPPGYWLYPSYADLDWDTLHESQKRFLDTSKDPELFGLNNELAASTSTLESEPDSLLSPSSSSSSLMADGEPLYQQQKRHIGSIARSGFLPSYRALHSTYDSGYGGGYGGYGGYGGGGYGGYGRSGNGGGGLRFNRYGRARQFVEYFPQREPLRKPIAADCKRCFLPYRPVIAWGGGGVGGGTTPGVRGGFRGRPDMRSSMSMSNNLLPTNDRRPLALASTSPISTSSWGTPPRITALHRRSFRRPIAIDSYQY